MSKIGDTTGGGPDRQGDVSKTDMVERLVLDAGMRAERFRSCRTKGRAIPANETGQCTAPTQALAREEGGVESPMGVKNVPAKDASGSPPAPPSATKFHQRVAPLDYTRTPSLMKRKLRSNLAFVVLMTCATNILILAVPIYLFQISDRVFTSRSIDTLVMLTIVILGAIMVQTILDALRRLVLMRSAVDVAARLGAPVLSAAAQAATIDSAAPSGAVKCLMSKATGEPPYTTGAPGTTVWDITKPLRNSELI